jgi:periplasmic protein TonB
MFDDSLLESSPKRAPVLKGKHWIVSLAAGIVVFGAAFFGIPMVIPGNETKVVIAQAAIIGVVVLCFCLMLCYIIEDSKQTGTSTVGWFIVGLLLPLVGFVGYLVYTAVKTQNWKRATLPIAYMFEVIVVGVMILVPLIYTDALPKTQLMTFLAAPPPPPPPPPPPAAPAPVVHIQRRVTVDDLMKTPTVIPKQIKVIKDEPQAPQSVGVVGGVPGGMPGGQMGGVLGGVIGGVLSSAPPPPPPPKAATPKRIRVGGNVEQAKLIFNPSPEYPPLAKMARIQGTVRLEAIISKDGTIQDLKVLSGHPLLVKSAIDAVSRWRYQPTLLNGDPVEVVTEIDVNFTLAE